MLFVYIFFFQIILPKVEDDFPLSSPAIIIIFLFVVSYSESNTLPKEQPLSVIQP